MSTTAAMARLLLHLRGGNWLGMVQIMDQIPPLISRPPRRTGWIVYSIVVTFFLAVSVLANLALLGLTFGVGRRESPRGLHKARYEEEYIDGDAESRNKIVV